MNMTDHELFQKNLYNLLWYLSGWGGCDYSATTRRDMIEGVLENLRTAGLLTDAVHATGVRNMTNSFENHPFHDQVRECLESMPREVDEDLAKINAFGWVVAEEKSGVKHPPF